MLDPLQPPIHHFTVKTKQTHILSDVLLFSIAIVHHSLQLICKVCCWTVVTAHRCFRSHHMLPFACLWSPRSTWSFYSILFSHLEIILAFLKHYELRSLFFFVESFFFQLLLERELKPLVLKGFSSMSSFLPSFEHLRFNLLEETRRRRLHRLTERTKVDGELV